MKYKRPRWSLVVVASWIGSSEASISDGHVGGWLLLAIGAVVGVVLWMRDTEPAAGHVPGEYQ